MTTEIAPAARPDNLLGICHSLGEILGFNPIYPRLALLVALMLNPEYALIAYAVAGVAVLVARLATRSRAKKPAGKLVYA